MSLDLYVCALDLEAFGAVSGSRSRALLDRVAATMKLELHGYDRYFVGQQAGVRPLLAVIEQIINGQLDAGTPVFQLEAAAAMIADTMGNALPVETLREAKGDFVDDVNHMLVALREDNGIASQSLATLDEILARGPYLDIPLDAKMRLGSGYWSASEVAITSAALTARPLKWRAKTKRMRWPELAREAVNEYFGWIDAAARIGRGLFMHR